MAMQASPDLLETGDGERRAHEHLGDALRFLPGQQNLGGGTRRHGQLCPERDGVAEPGGALHGGGADADVTLAAEELGGLAGDVTKPGQDGAGRGEQGILGGCTGQLDQAGAEHEPPLEVPTDEPVMLQGHGQPMSRRAGQACCGHEARQGQRARLEGGQHGSVAIPNLTIVDTGIITAQVQSMIGQVIQAVQFLFLFTLLAGGIVLHAAMSSVRDEQVAEMALMRALGASRRQLAWAHLLELGLVGLLAGAMAVAGASLLGRLLARQVFDLAYQPAGWLMLAGMIGSLLFVVLAGGWGVRRLLDVPPLQALRAG